MIIGIDASNIRGGGTVTHLVETLRCLCPQEFDISRIVVWGGSKTLALIDNHSWLEKRAPLELELSLTQRVIWQKVKLSKAALEASCDLLFVPGGSYVGNFRPVVMMSQNILPFEMPELLRDGWSWTMVKNLLLRSGQSRAFRHADGVIFLTEYGYRSVLEVTGKLRGRSIIIPHGLTPRFLRVPKPQLSITEYDTKKPYRLLYVSSVLQYKHQWHVVESVAALRREGLPIVLDIIGSSSISALARLDASIHKWDPERNFICYYDEIPYGEINEFYDMADLFVFASSCESFGIALLEAMSAGLPIACSNRSAMPEILSDAGVYFDPEKPKEITNALRYLIESPKIRTEKSMASYQLAQKYSWDYCTKNTFSFLAEIALQFNGSKSNRIC
jgi:hypothetical protein